MVFAVDRCCCYSCRLFFLHVVRCCFCIVVACSWLLTMSCLVLFVGDRVVVVCCC